MEKRRSDAIIGAIGGDIIGSAYEFKGARYEDIKFFKDECGFTDDTVLTVAVADWLMNRQKPLRDYLLKYGRAYFKAGYGPSFTQWLKSPNPRPYNSCGNGSAMRVSAVGCVAQSTNEAMILAKESAIPTHNHPEGIKGAQAIAVAICLARHKTGKEMMKAYLTSMFDYDFNRSYKDIYNTDYSFNVICQTTVPEALICFFESDSYEDCIKKAMLTNMDTDTAAAVAGAVAGAFYGISDDFRKRVLSYLPDEFVKVIEKYDEDDVDCGCKTIVYLHGFGSSGQSGTVNYLRKMMPEYNVLAPDIPVNPAEALPFLKDYCEKYHPDLVIGTSMGAMYAMQLFDYRRICVNPALRMSQLSDILKPGTFEYFQPTLNGDTHFTITENTIQQFRNMEAKMYEGLTDESRRWCWGFFGDEDTTVDCKKEFLSQFFPNVQLFHGGHRMTNKTLEKVILPFAKMLLEEDKTDEWGVTYSNYGRILKEVDPQLFTCEEYTIPEGVEVMDGTFWLTDTKLRKINLPSSLRKMEVNTFIRCPLEKLELPEGITEIPEFMCECCRELKEVVLPSTIKEIMHGAFNCCSKLQKINLPHSIERIGSGAFRFCESLKNIVLPSSVDEISDEVFYCSGIESIEIHKNITGIRQWAFWGCKHLRCLVIPEWITCIEEGVVTAHEGFEGVECHAKGFHVENDALIDDERQELLCCWTQQKNYVVPECIRRIADISGNGFVETITVKQPVELTTYEVFASDTNLRRVDFRGGVTGLTQQTFWNCPKLENN